ncbi:hypothetical protein ZIOFF_065137 [Zingiber officinale]|uniref:Rab-GAP TBC domain-containing protein n=1 Tax=Zingiber officinale TaxID=94328 RepID=A0A8J5KGW9_ZINOF|nr:hypothetical protein ZIOFF_065137 [Zingiber officinale]
MDADSRDLYGFPVRPQYLQIHRDYAKKYKEEEEERIKRWKDFLDKLEVIAVSSNDSLVEVECSSSVSNVEGRNDSYHEGASPEIATETKREGATHKIQRWSPLRSTLTPIEQLMSHRVKKWSVPTSNRKAACTSGCCHKLDDNRDVCGQVGGASEEWSTKEFDNVERLKMQEAPHIADLDLKEVSHFPWIEELESLVHGGVPMALRGEVWQVFANTKFHRIEGYYDKLLDEEAESSEVKEHKSNKSNDTNKTSNTPKRQIPDNWRQQIEKDLPRTFPGHPSLSEDGRSSLRHLLLAYARYNPSVGYCQVMNFFAGLLLLLMPEENAFWTLASIIDGYFDGYYSKELFDSQVDQLVLEDLVREKLPALVNHLEHLGVQVAWITGPWFLSVFVNILPWESVLRVWDVLIFDGNRVMLFRTTLALMDLYGTALETTKDAGEAITLLQTLVGSTFDSSQLMAKACLYYQTVNEEKLEHLRRKHRADVIAVMEERSKGLHSWKDSFSPTSKLLNFNYDSELLYISTNSTAESGGDQLDTLPDLQEQVAFLKVELCRLLEEKQSAILRAEEFETTLMETVKQDNRRLLSVKVEKLEREASELRQTMTTKQQKENAMHQVLRRLEQERKVTEDARILAEQAAAAQKYATHMLQEKYEETMAALSEMEKRAINAERMLESTLQSQSSSTASSPRLLGLLSRPFGSWLDKNKGKPEMSSEDKISSVASPKISTDYRPRNDLQQSDK